IAEGMLFTPNDESLVTVGPSSQMRVWNAASQSRTAFIRGPNRFDGWALTPDGHTLAAGCWDGNVYLWDLSKPHYPVSLPTLACGKVISTNFPLPDLGCKVVSADGAVHAIAPGQTEWTLDFTIPKGEWYNIACANDGKNVAMRDGHAHLFHWN